MLSFILGVAPRRTAVPRAFVLREPTARARLALTSQPTKFVHVVELFAVEITLAHGVAFASRNRSTSPVSTLPMMMLPLAHDFVEFVCQHASTHSAPAEHGIDD